MFWCTTTPIIKIQAVPILQTEFWAFKNLTIDYGLCQSNCTSCETYSRCLICDSGFKLYRGTCVNPCPIHTTLLANGTCQDFEDILENSRYLVKAFYDMNTTFEGVSSIIDNFTDLAGAIKTSFTGSIYSFVMSQQNLNLLLNKIQLDFNIIQFIMFRYQKLFIYSILYNYWQLLIINSFNQKIQFIIIQN